LTGWNDKKAQGTAPFLFCFLDNPDSHHIEMIQLPELFERKLSTVPELDSAVRESFKRFEPWLEQSGMPFFPGFTDHSPRHINEVLNTAASLVSDASRDLLSAEDVAVLCISILLHDSGMHLTRDSFRALVSDFTQPIISGLGDLPWARLWEDFLSEARRFGQDQLLAIFGDPDVLQVGELDLENLSELDDLLIGEFVRRHHSRLAHEIAVKGVPTTKGNNPLELIGLDPELRDLAGLIGRSHGMSIRATFPYIENKYSLLPEYRRIKTPYLMAVLRIADYVQVKSERALKSLLSVKELRSPISRQEWRNHFAVRDVSQRHDDPEALFVNAKPIDVRTYLKLESLFRDIQRELDESWATLGEVYGRQGELAALGLTWRRIRSNLDDKDKFSKTIPYIPIRAGFDASGPDLLKLLVGPLYNYEYEVGIRELVQNAVDACKELVDLLGNTPIGNGPSDLPDVLVDIHENNDGTGWITVTDRGVGMTADTITHYFLVAGASFRNSDVWKQQHMNVSGEARVMRGGRFGVGALAAFLLGEEVTVQTRHASRSEEDGLEFKARIDDPVVELRRCTAPAGTSIKIWVENPSVINNLRPHKYFAEIPDDLDQIFELDSWPKVDWFVQSKPRVTYRWNGYSRRPSEDPDELRVRFRGEYRTPSDELVPLPESPDVTWHALAEPHPYKAVFWQYRQPKKEKKEEEEFIRRPSDEITVNGIRVEKLRMGGWSSVKLVRDAFGDGPQYRLSRPSMAIFDPAGVCPINLQRSAVSFDRMGFDGQLSKALLREHLTYISNLLKGDNTFAGFRKLCADIGALPDVHYEGQVIPFCATSKGIFLATPGLFSELKIRVLLLVDSEHRAPQEIAGLLKDGEALLFRISKSGPQNDLAWFRGILAEDNGYDWYRRNCALPRLARSAAVLAMRPQLWQLANQEGKVKRQIIASLTDVPNAGGHKVVMSGDIGDSEILAARVKELLVVLGKTPEIGAWKLTPERRPARSTSLIHEVWIEVFGGPYVRSLTAELKVN
jgi:hypothetical protein